MPFGLAALAVVLEQLLAIHLPGRERGDEEEAVEQQIALALLDHQHDAARLVPALGPVCQFMRPEPGFARSPPRQALHVRCCELVEGGICAQARDMMDAAVLQPVQKYGRRKAGIDAHHGDFAQADFGTVDHVEDDIERSVGGPDIAGAQAGVEHVAGLGDGSDERVIDAGSIVAVPLRLRLMPMDLNRQAVDIERDVLEPSAAVLGQ